MRNFSIHDIDIDVIKHVEERKGTRDGYKTEHLFYSVITHSEKYIKKSNEIKKDLYKMNYDAFVEYNPEFSDEDAEMITNGLFKKLDEAVTRAEKYLSLPVNYDYSPCEMAKLFTRSLLDLTYTRFNDLIAIKSVVYV